MQNVNPVSTSSRKTNHAPILEEMQAALARYYEKLGRLTKESEIREIEPAQVVYAPSTAQSTQAFNFIFSKKPNAEPNSATKIQSPVKAEKPKQKETRSKLACLLASFNKKNPQNQKPKTLANLKNT